MHCCGLLSIAGGFYADFYALLRVFAYRQGHWQSISIVRAIDFHCKKELSLISKPRTIQKTCVSLTWNNSKSLCQSYLLQASDAGAGKRIWQSISMGQKTAFFAFLAFCRTPLPLRRAGPAYSRGAPVLSRSIR